jgi:hypothetical protein
MNKAPWPFPQAMPDSGDTKPEVEYNDYTVDDQPAIQKVFPTPGEYQIEIHGRGTESGIGKITKAQYDYWSERDEDELP